MFGLGASARAERLVVDWPDGRTLVIENPPTNQRIAIEPPAATDSVAQAGEAVQ